MNIHEFQGKQLFAAAGILVPAGRIAKTPQEAAAVAKELGGKVVVKSQIHAGGRGKGHIANRPEIRGVKVVTDPQAASDHAEALLEQHLITHQTGPGGQMVRKVLVEQASQIKKELYLAFVLDRDSGRVACIASTEGGMDIEEVAAKAPEKVFHQTIDPASGLMPFHGRNICQALALEGEVAKQGLTMVARLYQLFLDKDLSMLEINPLIITADHQLMALDAKISCDDNALFRHPDLQALRDLDEEDPKERIAKDANLSYVALEGNIGCLVNGAGLAMATMDIIQHCGGKPANFLDVGGGATQEMVTKAFRIILSDPHVRAILVNIFGGIAKCDVIANGVVAAAKDIGLKVPLVVRLEGTNVELGKKILAESGLAITPASNMLDAAQAVVAAAGVKR